MAGDSTRNGCKIILKCGITNSLDGTEDDLVFDSSSDESFDDDLIDKLFASDSESDFEGF